MELGELIATLEAEDPAKVLPYGFAEPHCWRGDYYDLAFDPAQNVTVASMLAHARSAVNATYGGWKGGEYTMSVGSDCYLATRRDLGETLGPTLLRLMLAAGTVPDETAAPAEGEPLDPETITVYISIGNSDDKLTQQEWSQYTFAFADELKRWASHIHGFWHSLLDSPFQNANACVEIWDGDVESVRRMLARLAADYRQDSIAWAVVSDTEFITPDATPEAAHHA